MPLSWHGQVSAILDAVVCRQPRTVLDIGCGNGAIGPYLRQYGVDRLVAVDAAFPIAGTGETSGLAAYETLIEQPWPDAARLLKDEVFDLALLVDVIEHCEYELGTDVLGEALEHARAVVVATPHDPMRWPQDDLANPYEQHRRRWPLDDFCAGLGTLVEAHHLTESIVVVLER